MAVPDLNGPSDTSALLAGVRVVRERWWVVLAALVACVLLIVGNDLRAEKEYSATSSLLLGQDQISGVIDPNANQSDDPVRDASTNLLLVQTSTVAERVKQALKSTDTADDLRSKIVANAEPDADIITIEATDADPQFAAKLANAFAEQFVGYRADADRQRIARGEALLRQQIAALPADAGVQRAELQQNLQTVAALKAVAGGGATVVDRATAPSDPSSPKTKRDAILAIVLGLVLGVALAFLIDLFDRRLKAIEDVEAAYRLTTLTSVPERPRDPDSMRDRQAALEPFRILRNAMNFLSAGADMRVVLVTSAVPGEGKSTVAAGLARAAALAGQRVVLVEADLRRPTFHEQFDLRGDARGLTTALVGGTPVTELLRPVLPGLRSLMVLPSGPTPPNAAELLRSAEMGRVLDDLCREADVVILDAPPLLPVADSQVLLDNPRIDAALIVARTYHTTRDQARRARAILDQHPGATTGLVVNGVRENVGAYDYYGGASAQTRSTLTA